MVNIPTKLKDVNFYVDGRDWMGKGEIKLPDISHKTQDVSPMGIAGTISLPNVGDVEPLKGEMFQFLLGTLKTLPSLIRAERGRGVSIPFRYS